MSRYRNFPLRGAALIVVLAVHPLGCDNEPEPSGDVPPEEATADLGNDTSTVPDTIDADGHAPEPRCDDGVQNGDEEDVDCGGSSCEPCPIDCTNMPWICPSDLYCSPRDVCEVPTCDDGSINGGEPDVDCGGPCPDRCPSGSFCFEDSDCVGALICDGQCAAE